MRYTFAQSQVRSSADGIVVGYGVQWGSRNSYGEVFMPGAFTDTLGAISNQKPLPMRLEHRETIGKWTAYSEDQIGLRLEGEISETSAGSDAKVLLSDGAITGMSIGFWPEEERLLRAGESVSSNGFTFTAEKPTYAVLRARLAETSIVTTPSDDDARVLSVRSDGIAPDRADVLLPGLREDAGWEEIAYSMAVLFGARGGVDLRPVAESERKALYDRLAAAYERMEKSAPPFSDSPNFNDTEWVNDEPAVYRDLFLGKAAGSLVAATGATDRPLSDGTKERLREAQSAIGAALAVPQNDRNEAMAQFILDFTAGLS